MTKFDISWCIDQPIPSYSNLELPIKLGDNIGILYYDEFPVICERAIGNDIKSLLETIHKCVNRTVTDEEIPRIYPIIGNFGKETRLSMVKKVEEGELLIKELLGDHIHFNGNIKYKDNMWHLELEN